MSEYVQMITSLFLLFVAFGILIGSIVVSFGSFSAIVAGLAGVAVLACASVILMNRRATS